MSCKDTFRYCIADNLERIRDAKEKKQAEVDAVKNSLEPEYRYDGSVITGLNKFGESEIKFEDEKKVLALLATKKFHDMSGKKTTDLHFSDIEINDAVKCFYDFNHLTLKGHCPKCDCQKQTGIWLSLSDYDFQITEDYVDKTGGFKRKTDRYTAA